MTTDVEANSDLHGWGFPDELYSSSNTRGLYNPLHFVVRLRKDFHERLNSSPGGILKAGEGDFELLSAFSTYFHETIHWWQHVGSTSGLMLSFAYPAQAHINHRDLLEILRTLGPFKSLKTFLVKNDGRLAGDPQQRLNRIINNWHDIEFNRRIILDPLRVRENVTSSPFFEAVGHSLQIGLANALVLLSSTFDRDLTFLPNFKNWEAGFDDLRKRKVRGYFHGSDIHLVPLGAIRIFEGQARFCQLQYLHLASERKLGWDDFQRMGMFADVYVDAFEKFLKWAELEWPDDITDPTVSLFLLICDLAMNPCDGYPFDVTHFESFIESNDPSVRFMWFSRHVAKNPSLKRAITKCNRDEYLTVSTALCRSMVCRQPVEMGEQIYSWMQKADSLKQLLREDESFEFGNENLPVRVFFAKHLRFMEDKMRCPEFFCWPAMHMVETPASGVDLQRSMELFGRHQPLFTADLDGEIRPSLFKDRDEAKIYQTFNDFYGWNVLYDLVRQWTVTDGPFNYDYTWLTPRYSAAVIKPWVNTRFKDVFNFSLDDFKHGDGNLTFS